MIKDELSGRIMKAMKEGEAIQVKVLREVKTAIMNWETAKENVGKKLDEATEIAIIRKLQSQYKDAAEQCNDGKHDDLVQENKLCAYWLSQFLPAPVSEKDILACFEEIKNSGVEPVKKNMKVFMGGIKQKFPSADGKQVSSIISKQLG